MRIAVTYENGGIFQHFGHTSQFKLYDVEDSKVTRAAVIDTNGSGHGALATFLQGDAVRKDIPWVREYLPSRRVNGVDCQDNTLKVYGFQLHDGKTALCYWNCVPLLTHTYEGTISMSVYGQDHSHIRLLELATGKLYKLPEELVEDLGNGGIGLRNIPLTDTPLAIVFG